VSSLMDFIHGKDGTESHKLMPTVHKNGETGGLAVDLVGGGGGGGGGDENFIEVVATSLYAVLHSSFTYPRNMKWRDKISMYLPTACVSAVQ